MSLSSSSVESALDKVYQAFFGPKKYDAKPADIAVLERGQNLRVPYAEGHLTVTTWGDRGPTVLLMHGWGGSRAQMTGFVDPLLQAGYRVVTYDQPAHGESDGTLTNILKIAPTMELVQKHTEPFEAIVAHSFGTLVTSYAIGKLNLLSPSKLVYFGSFNRLMDSLPRFQAIAQIPGKLIDGLRGMIQDQFGKDVLEAVVNETLVQNIHIPVLMFHDASDTVTPVEDSRAIAKAWKQVHYIETEGLGHRGALHSPDIHKQVVRFLTGR